MILPTASALGRFMACPKSMLLPQTPVPAGPAADRGTAIHRYMQNVQRGGDPFEGVPERFLSECGTMDLSLLKTGTILEVESSYGMAISGDTVTFLRLGEGIERAYPETTTPTIWGTADQVAYVDGVLTVRDWKTGQRVDSTDQIQFLSLCVWDYYGQPEKVRGEYGYLEADGTWSLVGADYDAFDLELYKAAILSRLRSLEGAKVPSLPADVTPGTHCRYCPAVGHCPAALGAADTAIVTTGGDPTYAYSPFVEGPDHAAWLYRATKMLEPLVESVAKAIRRYADETGFTVDGKPYMRTMSGRSSMSAQHLEALARQMGASDEAIEACRLRLEFPVYRLVTVK